MQYIQYGSAQVEVARLLSTLDRRFSKEKIIGLSTEADENQPSRA